MNKSITRLSAAVLLGLGLMDASLAADAASAAPAAKAHMMQSGAAAYGQGKVIHLGTITVTRADAEGAKPKAKVRPSYGRTAYLGKLTVTAADSPVPRAAEAAAHKSGTLYLGTVTVTAEDSEQARYAAAEAEQPGTMYLGSVRVTPRDAKAPVIGGVLAATHFLAPKTLLSVISTLVIDRAGG